MRIAGHLFAIEIGLVDQSDLSPLGPTFAYAMQKADLRRSAGSWDDTTNFNMGFSSSFTTNRRSVIRVSDFYDDLQDFTNLNLSLVEGSYYRMAMTPKQTEPVSAPGIIDPAIVDECYLFPVVRLAEGSWSPDANSGQPIDLTFETVRPYYIPGDTGDAGAAVLALWSFSP